MTRGLQENRSQSDIDLAQFPELFVVQTELSTYVPHRKSDSGNTSVEVHAGLPDTIALDTFRFKNYPELDDLFSARAYKKIFSHLPTSIELLHVSPEGTRLLIHLAHNHLAQEILDRIQVIRMEDITEDSYFLLKQLYESLPPNMLYEKLPAAGSIYDDTYVLLHLLLIEIKKPEAVIASIGDKIDLNQLTFKNCRVFVLLFNSHLIYNQIVEALPATISAEFINSHPFTLLLTRVIEGPPSSLFAKVITRLTGQIDFSVMTEAAYAFWETGLSIRSGNYILPLMPEKIPVFDCTKCGGLLLRSMERSNYHEFLFDHVELNLQGPSIQDQTLQFLEELFIQARSMKGVEYLQELIAKVSQDLRTPLHLEAEPIFQSLGPTVAEQIRELPIIHDSKKDLPGGWQSYQLHKMIGTSRILVLIQHDPVRVIFRNDRVNDTATEALTQAQQIIPEYISSFNYPELTDPPSLPIPVRKSYQVIREVYAGTSLQSLKYAKLPESIRRSIGQQIIYILARLSSEGIVHQHPHARNFNVRFLIEKNGEKQVYFDPTEAIQIATSDPEILITPIVVLRDWDAARTLNS